MKRHTYKHESGDAFWWALMLSALALLLLGCSSPREYPRPKSKPHWQARAHENRGKQFHRMVYREHTQEWVCVHCNYNNQNKKYD